MAGRGCSSAQQGGPELEASLSGPEACADRVDDKVLGKCAGGSTRKEEIWASSLCVLAMILRTQERTWISHAWCLS